MEIGDSNMSVLVEEVGREESGEEGGGGGGGEEEEEGERGEQRGDMGDEAGRLALDISQLLLVSLSVYHQMPPTTHTHTHTHTHYYDSCTWPHPLTLPHNIMHDL